MQITSLSAYSSMQVDRNRTQFSAGRKECHDNTTSVRNTVDSVDISEQAKLLLSNDIASQETFDDRVLAHAYRDPVFAKEMVTVHGYQQDRMLFSLPSDPGDQQAWDEIDRKQADFKAQAAPILERRVAMCEKMKSEGKSDAEIFKAIMDFNKDLPLSYRRKCNLAGGLN